MGALVALVLVYLVLLALLARPAQRRSAGTSFASHTQVVFVDATPGAEWTPVTSAGPTPEDAPTTSGAGTADVAWGDRRGLAVRQHLLGLGRRRGR